MKLGEIHFSSGYFRMLGYPDKGFPETFSGWAEHVHPDDLGMMQELIDEYHEGRRQTHAAEFRMRHRDGTWRWILSRGCIFPEFRLIGTHVDITSERQTRDRLTAAREFLAEELRERVERLRAMDDGIRRELLRNHRLEGQLRQMAVAVEQSPVSVMMTDVHGCIEYVNRKFEEVSGWGLSDISGLNPRVLKSGAQPPEFYRAMWATLTRGETWRGELHNARRDGTSYWEFAVIAPITDGEGRITGYVALKEDITALKEAELRNASLREEMTRQERLCVIGQTVATVAHSMKNLLTVFQGGLYILSAATTDRIEVREIHAARSIIDGAVCRLRVYLGELLDYSKSRRAEPEKTDVPEVIDRIVQFLRGAAEIRRIRLLAPLPSGPLVAWIDRGALEGALLNLCMNAFDAMPDGGELRVVAREEVLSATPPGRLVFDSGSAARASGSSLVLSVEDSGTGIDPAVFDRLFDPFFSTKGSRGTGLGLCTVRQFVADHRGDIYLDSHRGRGTTFTLVFPPSIFECAWPEEEAGRDMGDDLRFCP